MTGNRKKGGSILDRKSSHLSSVNLNGVEKLSNPDSLYQSLFENAGIGIGFWSTDGILLDLNRMAAKHLGGEREDFVGKRCIELFGEADGQEYLDRIAATVSSLNDSYWDDCIELSAGRRWFRSTYSPVFGNDGNIIGVQIISEDITETKLTEIELKSANKRLETLWGISSLKDADIKTLFDHILASITIMTDSSYGFYGLVNDDESIMTIHTWSGEAMKDCAMADKPAQFLVSEAGIWAEAIRQRKPLILNDYSAPHEGKKGTPEGHVKLTKLLVVPCIIDGRIVALAAVANREQDYGQEDINQISAFLNNIQIIVNNRLTEKALRKSEEKFKRLTNTTKDWVFQVNTNAVYTFVSPNIYQIMGYRADEVLGKTPFDFMTKNEAERISNIFGNVAAKKERVSELRDTLISKEGKPVHFETNAIPILNNDGELEGYFGTCRDITDRVVSEEILRENERRLREAEETGQLGHVEFNVETGEIIWADILYEMYERDPAAGPPSYDEVMALFHPEDAQKLERCIEQAVNKAESYRIDLKISLPSGKHRHHYAIGVPRLDKNGKVIKVLGTVQDITERKLNEIELKRYRQLLEQAEELTMQGAWEWDVASDKWYFSDNWCRIHGVDFAEISKDKLMTLTHPEDASLIDAEFEKALKNGSSYDIEHRIIRADNGEIRLVRASGRAIFDEDNKPVRMYGSCQDITEQKGIENQLKRIEWMLSSASEDNSETDELDTEILPPYGDLTELNKSRVILDAVGKDLLIHIAGDYNKLLQTSGAIYEANGDYALEMFTSNWCRLLDTASRKLCGTEDNREALVCGKWHCHESCWRDCAKHAIKETRPVDMECAGGIRLYAVPIKAGNKVIGAVNFGYGDPPTDDNKLEELSEKYDIDKQVLLKSAVSYQTRPPYIIEMAKQRLKTSATLIGSIVERKLAENALRENEEKFRFIAENIGDIVLSTDQEGNYTYISPSHKNILGRGDEVIGQSIFDYIHPDDRERIANIFKNAIKSGKPERVEYRYLHPEKGCTWMESVGRRYVINNEIRTIVTSRDISERKNAELELARERDRARQYLDIAGVIMVALDVNGNVALINRKGCEVLGYSADEMLGKNWFDNFLPEENFMEVKEIFNKLLSGQVELVKQAENKIITEDGKKRDIAWRNTLIRDSDGTIIGTLSSGEDITEKLLLENELQKQAKLESIGVLAGGIAHDFNNILTAITGNISLARLECGDDLQLSKILKQAATAADRAGNLTNQLLTFSKGGTPVKKVTVIDKLIKEAAEFGLHGSNVACNFELAKDLMPAEIDAGQITQVINNLVINASQAMPDGGVIRIKAQNHTIVNKDRTLPLEPGEYICISVADEGVGIPQKYLKRVFDPFFTTKDKGNGLGLASCYSIIKKHYGHITVSSEQGVGTQFTFYLPATEKVPATGNKKTSNNIKGQGRILVVDDDEPLRKLASMSLSKCGYEVETASDGEMGFRMYRDAVRGNKPYDIVILDLTIPGGMGGKDTLEKMKKIDPSVSAIVSSGYSNDPVMSEYKKYGFRACLVKPFRADELNNIVHDVISVAD